MREEANLQEYAKLLSIAEDIKKLNPWRYFNELDFTTILLPSVEEPYYLNTLFDEEDGYTINIYAGFSAINGFLKVLSAKDMPISQLIRYEKSIIVCYGNKNYLLDEEIKLLEKLNKKYKGKNQNIYFRKIEFGYAPYFLDKYEVLETIEVLKEFYLAVNDYINNIKNINFESGRTLFRWFNPKEGMWETKDIELFFGEKTYNSIVLNDKKVVKQLKNKQRIQNTLEIDIIFLESIIEDKQFDKPIIPRLCVLADHESGLIINQEMVTPNEDDVEVILRILISYLLQYGRPKTILVRDEYISSILTNLCKKINIQIKVKEYLISIDSVCTTLLSGE